MPLTITNPFEQDGQEANNVSINAKAVMIEGLVTDLKKDYDEMIQKLLLKLKEKLSKFLMLVSK